MRYSNTRQFYCQKPLNFSKISKSFLAIKLPSVIISQKAQEILPMAYICTRKMHSGHSKTLNQAIIKLIFAWFLHFMIIVQLWFVTKSKFIDIKWIVKKNSWIGQNQILPSTFSQQLTYTWFGPKYAMSHWNVKWQWMLFFFFPFYCLLSMLIILSQNASLAFILLPLINGRSL